MAKAKKKARGRKSRGMRPRTVVKTVSCVCARGVCKCRRCVCKCAGGKCKCACK